MHHIISDAKVFYFGEALWDLFEKREIPGGAPLNGAYHLKKMGINPFIITRLGKDPRGMKLMDLIKSWDLNSSLIQIDESHPTGTAEAFLEKDQEVKYDFLFPCAWDFIGWEEEMGEVLSSFNVLVFGSLAIRNEISKKTLFKLLKKSSFKVLDVNLRRPYFSASSLEELMHHSDLIKLNLEEFEKIVSWFCPDHLREKKDQIVYLFDKFPFKEMIITKGDQGVTYYNKAGEDFSKKAYLVEVKDTIGSGDAFLAGFLFSRLKGVAIEESLDFSLLMGAFLAKSQGACPNYNLEDIERFKASFS